MAGEIAAVYFHGRRAGSLSRIPGGYRFVYDDDYLIDGRPIAYTLPLRRQPFDGERLPPFFDNLVSEGWLKQQQSLQQQVDERDHFNLLLANGEDLPGAVTVKPL